MIRCESVNVRTARKPTPVLFTPSCTTFGRAATAVLGLDAFTGRRGGPFLAREVVRYQNVEVR